MRILVAAIAIAVVCGCKNMNSSSYYDNPADTNGLHQTSGAFNDKQYIWQNWFINNDTKVK